MKNMQHIKKMNKSQSGFTLLELLVVVGIMAVLGGAMISSFGGQEEKAAKGAATQTIAGIEDAMRIYQAVNDGLPNNMEALACIPYNAAYDAAAYGALTVSDEPSTNPTGSTFAVGNAYKFGGESNASGFGGGLGKKVAEKFNLAALDASAATALQDVGINSLRYAGTAACDNDPATIMTVGSDTVNGTLVGMDIPAHAFEDLRPGARNRGRGFSSPVLEGAPVMIWDAGTNGYNNVKIGAAADDVLVGFGIGQASDLVGGADSPFAKAPFYGAVGKDKYAHYIALVNIGKGAVATTAAVAGTSDASAVLTMVADDTRTEGAAFVQAIVDARGDFLDEEAAEFTGQKS